VAFGEFAESIGERAEPRDAQEEIYVGLEHLDPQCLHIRRWGMGSDVIGGKLRFRKGDIIFGKRRAYQRKLAVAAFGGICSAHAMVIRARPDKVLPEFLPSLMMSDRFMNRAVEISVGSLSPTINWTTLKLETFDLPPLDQQRRIAEILWAVDEAENAHQELADQLASARLATVEAFVFGELNGGREKTIRWPVTTVGQLCHITSGKVNSSIAAEDGQYPFFTCAPEISKAHSFSFNCEALLLAGNNAQGVYTVKHFKGKFEARQRVYVITICDPAKITYRYLHLMMQRSLKRMQNLSVGSTSKHITLGDLQGIEIPLPSAAQQDDFVSRVSELESAFEMARQHVGSLANLKRQHLETALNFNAGSS
jgi:restriction endonuclease S subunit